MTATPQIIDGWLSTATKIASPNFNARPNVDDISLLVIHNISLPPNAFGGDDVIDFFCNQLDTSKHDFYQQIADLQVSAHLFIRRNGEVIQFVSFIERAWHAGVSNYHGRDNCNDFSIGIELEGADDIAYSTAQYQHLAEITKLLQQQYPAIGDNIVGHSDIAPKRKTDPGEAFAWDYYHRLLSKI